MTNNKKPKKRSRAKPRIGWEDSWHTRKLSDYISNEELEAICDRWAGTEKERRLWCSRGIFAAFEFYWAAKDEPHPTGEEQRAALKTVEKSANAFIKAMIDIDSASKRRLFTNFTDGEFYQNLPEAERKPFEIVEDLPDWSGTFMQVSSGELTRFITKGVEAFSIAANNAQQKIPRPKKGRPQNEILSQLIGCLVSAYEAATQSEPMANFSIDKKTGEYWSPFIEFATHCFDLIDPNHGYSNQAFGEAIRRGFSER